MNASRPIAVVSIADDQYKAAWLDDRQGRDCVDFESVIVGLVNRSLWLVGCGTVSMSRSVLKDARWQLIEVL